MMCDKRTESDMSLFGLLLLTDATDAFFPSSVVVDWGHSDADRSRAVVRIYPSPMSFKSLWSLSMNGISSRLKRSIWSSQWTHRLKRYKSFGSVAFSRRVNNSQWMLRRIRNALDRHGKKAIILSATGVYNATKDNPLGSYPWSDCNIGDDIMQELTDEMKDIESLKMATVICSVCKKRLVIDKMQPGNVYCSCKNNKAIVDSDSGWQPFLEDKDIIIWRREQAGSGGLFAYKVYGRYKEVAAEDFLAMHVDTKYWQSWDTSALSVRTLDGKFDRSGGQCVIHWEMLWPRFFTNRDYVYVRRYAYVNDAQKTNNLAQSTLKKDKLIVITSRSCDHPEVPETNAAYRVKKYWSNLVIKPFTAYDEPGIEFSLTYFDDPGANIPSSLQAWVAGQGMPDFLAKMRKAAALYKEVKKKDDETGNIAILIQHLPTPAPETSPGSINLNNKNEESAKESIVEKNIDPTQEFLNLLYEKSSNIEKKSPKINESNIYDTVQKTYKTEESQENVVNQSEEFINGSKSGANKNNADSLVNVEETKVEVTKSDADGATAQNAHENQEKLNSQSQSNSYNYWHLWPLYYFA